MTVTERVAYLKGLAAGLEIDPSSKEGKLFNAMIEALDDIAFEVSDLQEVVSELGEQVDMIDEDLDGLEEIVYDAVSYTHLDVYKRQELQEPFAQARSQCLSGALLFMHRGGRQPPLCLFVCRKPRARRVVFDIQKGHPRKPGMADRFSIRSLRRRAASQRWRDGR